MPEQAGLAQVMVTADTLSREAARNPGQFNGFDVQVADDRVTFRYQQSPTIYNQLALVRDETVGLRVEQQTQRPSLEDVGFGMSVRETTTVQLLAGAQGSVIQEKGRLLNNGMLGDGSTVESAIGFEADEQYLKGLNVYLLAIDESRRPAEKPPLSRMRSLLGRLGLSRSDSSS